MAAVGGSLSALEIARVARSAVKAILRFYNTSAEFGVYYVEYNNLDNYLTQNLDFSQQHPHLLELNGVIRCYLKGMKSKLDSSRAEMDTCCILIENKGYGEQELRARFKWILNVRKRAPLYPSTLKIGSSSLK